MLEAPVAVPPATSVPRVGPAVKQLRLQHHSQRSQAAGVDETALVDPVITRPPPTRDRRPLRRRRQPATSRGS
eukprot:6954200-Pyramimonas_sp.AAC.1